MIRYHQHHHRHDGCIRRDVRDVSWRRSEYGVGLILKRKISVEKEDEPKNGGKTYNIGKKGKSNRRLKLLPKKEQVDCIL